MIDSLEQVNGISGVVLHHLVGTPYTKNQEGVGCPGHGSDISREAMLVWVFLAVGCLEMLPVTGSQNRARHMYGP